MNNLFYDLPENLQDKIIRMNPHPLTDIFSNGYCKFKHKSCPTRIIIKLWNRVHINTKEKTQFTSLENKRNKNKNAK